MSRLKGNKRASRIRGEAMGEVLGQDGEPSVERGRPLAAWMIPRYQERQSDS